MKQQHVVILVILLLLSTHAAWAQTGFTWVDRPEQRKLELMLDGKPITAYCYFDSTEKPVLYPIRTVTGITITRGYPVAPRAGERTDHPHHVGLWLNYESVNGLDFWNNSTAIPAERKPHYGSIRHQRIVRQWAGRRHAELITQSQWITPDGTVLLNEETSFIFRREGNSFIIDRQSILRPAVDDVVFNDVKDGLLGLRVARELEMPSKQEDTFIDAQGHATTVPVADNTGVTGLYRNRQGATGDAVWGTQSPWVSLSGAKDGEDVSIVIFDHPRNPGYPAYWHARGYGLFAINPLGRKIFSQGKETLQYTLHRGEEAVFRYRVVIHSGKLTDAAIDELGASFTQ